MTQLSREIAPEGNSFLQKMKFWLMCTIRNWKNIRGRVKLGRQYIHLNRGDLVTLKYSSMTQDLMSWQEHLGPVLNWDWLPEVWSQLWPIVIKVEEILELTWQSIGEGLGSLRKVGNKTILTMFFSPPFTKSIRNKLFIRFYYIFEKFSGRSSL